MIVPIPQFTAPSYGDRTLNAVQTMRNWYPEKAPSGYVLVSAPGSKLIGTVANDAACRDSYYASTGQCFALNGNTLYEVSSGGTSASRGTISTSTGGVCMADNGITLFLVVNGTNGYTMTLASGSPAAIADANFPAAPQGAAFIDGYFVTCKGASGRFYLSQLYDGTDWTPVQFATAESLGDNLINVKNIGNELWLFGEKSVEVWYNTGNADFPFERINGKIYDIGLAAQYSVGIMDNSVYFIGSSQAGRGAVWAITGGQLTRVSTPYIESLTSGTYTPNWEGYCYRYDGHAFYALNNRSSGGSYVFDITEGAWFDRSALDSNHPVKKILNAFSNSGEPPYGFDATTGKIYEIRPEYNSENGTAISRIRIFGPIESNTKRVFHSQIRIEAEVKYDAIGTTSISATLDWTDDGGLTYSTARTMTRTVTSSTTGQRVIFTENRLGSSPSRYYRLTFTGPAAKLVLKKCELDLQEGRF